MTEPVCPIVLFKTRMIRGLSHPNESIVIGNGVNGYAVEASGQVLSFPDLLEVDLEHDSHFSTYSIRSADGILFSNISRLRKEALSQILALGATVEAHCLVADLDLKDLVFHRRHNDPSWDDLTPDEAQEVTTRVEAVEPILDGQALRWTWAYRTRRGYRLVFALAAPIPIGPGYEALLGRMISALRAAKVQADYACKDWTRLFRAPRVRREDGLDTSTAPWYRALDRSDDSTCYHAADPDKLPLPVADLPDPSSFTRRADQPDDTAAEELLASKPGQFAEQLLRSSPLHGYCFGKTPFAFRTGNRHTKLTQIVGMLVKLLRPQPWATPELAYALAREAVLLLDQDEDWQGKAWEMITSFWARQATGAADTPFIPGEQPTLPEEPSAPYGEMALDDKGRPFPIPNNVRVAIHSMGVRLWRDEHAERLIIEGLPGHGPRLDDRALNRLWISCMEQYQVSMAKEKFTIVVLDHAGADSRHPVRSYLDSLNWDDVPRLDSWMATYLGADPTPYVSAVGRLLLVAAVRRVRQPGSKFDEMVVLESAQGGYKSSALKALAVNEDWFSDSLPLAGDPRVVLEQTLGKWIIEVADLQGMTRKGVDDLKAFLSRSEDLGRMAYDRTTSERKRQFVIVGTTNDDTYLRDSTGNRRFWPVKIGRIDLPALIRDREQLWAEAALVEQAHGPVRLDPALYPAATEEQEGRRVLDPIEEALSMVLPEFGIVRSIDAFAAAGLDAASSSHEGNSRLGRAMRRLGWERTKWRRQGQPIWVYRRRPESGRAAYYKLIRLSPSSVKFVPDASTPETEEP